MNIVTIKQLMIQMEDIASRHMMIKSYLEGREEDVTAESKLLYPLMLTDFPDSIDYLFNEQMGNFPYKEESITISILDQPKKDLENIRDIYSTCETILHQVVNELARLNYNSDATFVQNVLVSKVRNFSTDDLFGYQAILVLQLNNRPGVCGNPFEPVT